MHYHELYFDLYSDWYECRQLADGGRQSLQGESVALFLECKFSEYLNSGKYAGIKADVYEKDYK